MSLQIRGRCTAQDRWNKANILQDEELGRGGEPLDAEAGEDGGAGVGGTEGEEEDQAQALHSAGRENKETGKKSPVMLSSEASGWGHGA